MKSPSQRSATGMLDQQYSDEQLALARRTPGIGQKDHDRQIDMVAMRRYRLARIQEQLKKNDFGAALLFGAVNVRYATGTRWAQIFNLHSPFRAAFVPVEGQVILFDWERPFEVAFLPEVVAEVREAKVFTYFPAGNRFQSVAESWAAEVDELMRKVAGSNRRIAIDIIEPVGMNALLGRGLQVESAEPLMEHATLIKSEDELLCMSQTVSICEGGLARIREKLRPGLTENELWAELHHANIAAGGEWIEYRLFASGGRINPWGQECSDRVIRAGELVGVDAGMIGPFGYGADVSRTFHCPPGRPTTRQRTLYQQAFEQLHFNLNLIKSGVSFRDFSEKCWPVPNEYRRHRYFMVAHGIGMGDEWPSIPFPWEWDSIGYDGVLEKNMTLCIESFIGTEGGVDGVKLEQMVVVREKGFQLLSTFPFEDNLLA